MKYIICFALIALGLSSFTPDKLNTQSAPDIQWMSWEDAVRANEESPKKIFIDVYTDWCGWCKKMDKTTFTDPEVVRMLNDGFYAVKLDAEQKENIEFNGNTFKYIKQGRRGVHELAYALLDGKLGYPAFVIMDEKFSRIMISPGYKKSPQLLKELTFAKEEIYKKSSWQDYNNRSD